MIGLNTSSRSRAGRFGAGLAVLVAGLIASLASPAAAQISVNATLRGTITDSTGAVVPGAAVTATNERTGDERTAITDATGGYTFPTIVSGPYVVKVELAGFKGASTRVTLNAGDVRGLDLKLEVGEQTEVVTVTAETEIIQTETGAREGLLNAKQIEDLSVIGRSSMELLRIMPGVVAPDLTQFEEVSFGGGANQTDGYTVNGVRSQNNTVTLDGSNLMDIGSNNGVIVSPNTDMVEVVKVQSSNYAAEFGTSGVQVSAITKSGGNEFHGSVYGYLRDSSLAANDRSNSIAGVEKPKSKFFYPGANLSGPIVKDKLFFFAGFELQRQDVDTGSNFAVVPTPAQRAGDFSEFLTGSGSNLNQPSVATIPQGFPGAGSNAPGNNLAPYIDPVGAALLGAFPQPNYTDPNNRFNYVLSALQPVDREEAVLRLDYNVSDSTKAYLRAARTHESATNVRGVWWGASSYELPSPNVGDNVGQSYSLGLVSVLSPTMTNEVLVSFSRLTLDNDFGDRSKVSLEGLGIPQFRGLYPREQSVTDLAPLALHSWGTQGIPGDRGFDITSDRVFAHNDALQFSNKLTKIFDTHAVKVGVSVLRGQKQQNFQNEEWVRSQYAPWGQPSTQFVFGDILTGRPVSIEQGTRTPEGEFQFWNIEAFIQDSWKITPNFTLEYGVRFAKVTNNQELNDIGAIFLPSLYDQSQGTFIDGDVNRLNGLAYVRNGEVPRGLISDRTPFWLPRVNFAWDVSGTGDTVIRGGAGMFFNRPMGNAEYDILRIPPNSFRSGVDYWTSGENLSLSNLSRLDPFSLLGAQSVDSISSESNDYPTYITTSLSVSRRLPWQDVLEVAYVGSFGRHLPQRKPINVIPDGTFLSGQIGNADLSNPLHRAALSSNVTNQFRPFPALAGVRVVEFTGTNNYHSLQATLSRQTGTNFQYFLTYTFSKNLGTAANEYDSIDPFDARGRTYGILGTDRTHLANLSWNWTLPDLVGESSNGLLKGLLNGWQISGISTYTSGAPLKLRFGGDIQSGNMALAFTGTNAHQDAAGSSVGSIGPVYSGDPNTDGSDVGEVIADINQIGFPSYPDTGALVQPYYIRYPSRNFHDITLMKNFRIGDGGKRLQLRLGMFNIFNQAYATTNANDVDTQLDTVCNVRVDAPNGEGGTSNVCDPAGGFAFTDQTLSNFGRINLKRGHRIIEVALKFIF